MLSTHNQYKKLLMRYFMNLKKIVFNKLLPKIYKFYLSINTKQYPLTIGENESALLLAPHADDESIGAGGTLAKYNKN